MLQRNLPVAGPAKARDAVDMRRVLESLPAAFLPPAVAASTAGVFVGDVGVAAGAVIRARPAVVLRTPVRPAGQAVGRPAAAVPGAAFDGPRRAPAGGRPAELRPAADMPLARFPAAVPAPVRPIAAVLRARAPAAGSAPADEPAVVRRAGAPAAAFAAGNDVRRRRGRIRPAGREEQQATEGDPGSHTGAPELSRVLRPSTPPGSDGGRAPCSTAER